MNNRWLLTLCALIAFAANSLLARFAIMTGDINPQAFTALRLFSGAVMLLILVLFQNPHSWRTVIPSWREDGSAISSLFVYMAAFSFAYLHIGAGLGALILFVSVQFTMLVFYTIQGQRLRFIEIVGIICAIAGLFELLWHDNDLISFSAVLQMVLAGVAWGGYTLLGKNSTQPLLSTTKNFIGALPLLVFLLPWLIHSANITLQGVVLAIVSGAIASGLGYALWYLVLKRITTVQAAVSQLSVPVIAAIGGVIMLGEPITMSFIIATTLILGGIALVIINKPAIKQ